MRLGRDPPHQAWQDMVEIKKVHSGFQVSGAGFREVFQSRFKAMMAAHAVALGDATVVGQPVHIVMPPDWGEPVLVEPGHAALSAKAG